MIFLTSRETPLTRLIETADKTFSAYHAPGEYTSAEEDTHPARERVLFASREQIFAGDWMMRRVPSLPAVLREEPGVCEPRLIKYELPSLFAAAAGLADSAD